MERGSDIMAHIVGDTIALVGPIETNTAGIAPDQRVLAVPDVAKSDCQIGQGCFANIAMVVYLRLSGMSRKRIKFLLENAAGYIISRAAAAEAGVSQRDYTVLSCILITRRMSMAAWFTFERMEVVRGVHGFSSGMPEHNFLTGVAWSATVVEYEKVKEVQAHAAAKRLPEESPYKLALSYTPKHLVGGGVLRVAGDGRRQRKGVPRLPVGRGGSHIGPPLQDPHRCGPVQQEEIGASLRVGALPSWNCSAWDAK